MTDNQKKLLMIQNIIDANKAYHEKFCRPIREHYLEAVIRDNYDLSSIKKVLQGNFNI